MRKPRQLVSASVMAAKLHMSMGELVGLIEQGIVPADVLVARSGKGRHVLSPAEVERAVGPSVRDKIEPEHGRGNG